MLIIYKQEFRFFLLNDELKISKKDTNKLFQLW